MDGIGACTKALKLLGLGHEVVDYVEIDKHAVDSYNAINGTQFEPQDITKWDKEIDVDLIMHGSPCQDFSLAGKQEGGDKGSGTRSSLMYETLRIVNRLRPKYVIWENVKNLISEKHRHNFEAYCKEMKKMGYTNSFSVLNAKDYGIPQKRERVFVISILGDERFEFPKPVRLKTSIGDYLDKEVDKMYYLTEDKIHSISHWKAYQKPFERVLGYNSLCPTITARGAGEEHSGMIIYCPAFDDTKNIHEHCFKVKETHKKFWLRKITPKESWRLMGFDDKDFEKAATVNTTRELYRQAGNSIAVDVLYYILRELFC